MTGKAIGRGANCSDTQSMLSMGSVRTVDREKLRNKARQFQMKENLRLAMCARIQQQLKKSSKVAEELATQVLKVLQQRNLPPDLSSDALALIVQELSACRHAQLALAAATKGSGPEENYEELTTNNRDKQQSGRQSSGSKDRSARSGDKQRKPSRVARAGSSSQINGQSNGGSSGGVDEDVYLTQSQLQQLSTGFRLPPRVSPKKEKNNGIWEEIVKFSSVEEQLEAKRKQDIKFRQRAELAERLNTQVSQKHQKKAVEREASEKFHHDNMQRLSEMEEDERRKEQQRLEKAKQLIQIQNEQRLAKMKQHERELQIKKAHESKIAELLKKQKEDDTMKEHARREREQERLRLVGLENQAQLEKKRQEKEKEREFEMKLAGDYVRMEDAKEAARKKQLEDMANNIKAKMKFFDDTAKAGMDAKAREEEARVRRFQEEYLNQQAETERKKKADAETKNRLQQEYLKQQMQEKKVRDDAAKRDLNKQAELWKQERIEAEHRKKLTNQQRTVRNMTQQEILRQQMRDKEQRLLEADQTVLEVQLNTSILDKIHKQTGSAQANGAVVVSETQNRSRELQEKEQSFLQQRPPRNSKF